MLLRNLGLMLGISALFLTTNHAYDGGWEQATILILAHECDLQGLQENQDDISSQDSFGNGPLHAVIHGVGNISDKIKAINILLNKGANQFLCNDFGDMPIDCMKNAGWNQQQCIRALQQVPIISRFKSADMRSTFHP